MFNTSFNFIKKLKEIYFHFIKIKIQYVLKKLQGISTNTIVARFVGGCVKKYLLNEEIDDIDIATILAQMK